jgi:hypothetical protein
MHSNKNLNILRFIALGAVGYYLFRVSKEESTFQGVNEGGNFSVNTSRVVDSLMPWVPIQNPLMKEAVKHGLKDFANDYLHKKGVNTK